MPEQRLRDLEMIAQDPDGFLAQRWDPDGQGPEFELPDGSFVKRLPSISFVIWDGGFAGVIGLRYQAGTTDLPATCLGHIGYGVVDWRRGEGLATRAVRELQGWLPSVGLAHADAAILPGNDASRAVMERAGAAHAGQQDGGAAHGGQVYDLWRIMAPPSEG